MRHPRDARQHPRFAPYLPTPSTPRAARAPTPHAARAPTPHAARAPARHDVTMSGASDLLKGVLAIMTVIVALAVFTLAVAAVARRLASRDVIEILPVGVAPRLAAEGVDGTELTLRLRDRIRLLVSEANRPEIRDRWVLAGEARLPRVEIPGVHASVGDVATLWEETFTHPRRQVVVLVSARPQTLAVTEKDWVMTARVSDFGTHEVAFDLRDQGASLRAIALAILADVDPYTAIAAFQNARECSRAADLARQALRQASGKAERAEAEAMLGLASECLSEAVKDPATVLERFRAAVRADSTSAIGYANIARYFGTRGQIDSSRRYFTTALDRAARASRGPKSDSVLAAIYDAWGTAELPYDRPRAMGFLRSARLHDSRLHGTPTMATTCFNLGRAYLTGPSPDTVRAMVELGRGLDLRDDVDVLLLYGQLSGGRGEWQGAADAYRRAVAIDSMQVEAQVGLGDALEHVGKAAEARGRYERAAAMSAPGSPICGNALARLRAMGVRATCRGPV